MEDLFTNRTLPELRSIGFIKVEKGESYESLYHQHPNGPEMLLIAKGNASVTVENQTFEVGPHSLVVFHQNVWHKERTSPVSPHNMLYFSMEGLHIQGLEPGVFMEKTKPFIVPLKESFFTVENQFYELYREFQENAARDPWVVRYKLAALLAELSRNIHKRPQLKKKKAAENVAAVVEYVHEHYSESISLESLARIALLSPFHFTRVFKEEMGRTPIQYLIKCRLEAAKQYLMNTHDSVEVISELVGYESHTHFQQAFKKMNGISPGKFRSGLKNFG